MEPIFENKTTLTDKEQYLNMQWTIIRAGTFFDKLVIWNLICIAFTLFMGFIFNLFYFNLILTAVLIPVCDAILLFRLKITVDRQYETQKNLFIGVEKTTRFYEDEVKTESEKSSLNVSYAEISKVISIEGYYIFIANGHFFPVDKSGFTVGDKNKFERFIVGKITPKRFKNILWHTKSVKNAGGDKMTDHCKQIIDTLGCECELFEHETDGDKIIARYKQLLAEGKNQGFTPLLIAADDNLAEMMECNFEDSKPLDAVNKAQIKSADAFFAERKDMYDDMLEDADSGDIPENCAGGIDRFSTHLDVLSRKVLDEIILAKIPTNKPWELALWAPMGGWNDCPMPEEQAAVFKLWYEKYGAYPAIVTGDTWELYIERPIRDEKTAYRLANEMYLFCTDIVDQGVESIGALAKTLIDSSVWYFWWD